jgi:hypothetical protein
MTRPIDTFLADLGLKRADHPVREWGDDPGSKIRRACLNHTVMNRMQEEAEKLAPFLNLSRDVVFGLLRDLASGEAERSPFDLVAREDEVEREEVAAEGTGVGGAAGSRR